MATRNKGGGRGVQGGIQVMARWLHVVREREHDEVEPSLLVRAGSSWV